MNKKIPKVTVLMPVYNGEKYLSESIESILNQTFTDFEFLIINDGSTDHSAQIIEKYDDPRIYLIYNPKTLGLPVSLNKGLELAQGQYIARMDCDDICYPERLEKQVQFMDNHPEIGVCGTRVEFIGQKSGIGKYPLDNDEIRISLLFTSALAHPSVMIRKSKFREHNLYYDSKFIIAQDFELWQRCINYFPFANLPDVLIKYRFTYSSHFNSKKDKNPDLIREIYRKALGFLNITLKEEEYKIHQAISTPTFLQDDPDFAEKARRWLQKLYNANLFKKRYPESLFLTKLANQWFWTCYKGKELGLRVWKSFWLSPLSKNNKIPMKFKVKFVLKAILLTVAKGTFSHFPHQKIND